MEPIEEESSLERKIEENISMEYEIKEPGNKRWKSMEEELAKLQQNEFGENRKTIESGIYEDSEENEMRIQYEPEIDENRSGTTQTLTCEYVKKIFKKFSLLTRNDVVGINMENNYSIKTLDKKKTDTFIEEIIEKSNRKSLDSQQRIIESEEVSVKKAKLYNGLLLKDLQKAEGLIEKEIVTMSGNSKSEYFYPGELIAARKRICEEENVIKDLVAHGDLHIEGFAMFWKEYLSQIEC